MVSILSKLLTQKSKNTLDLFYCVIIGVNTNMWDGNNTQIQFYSKGL